MLLACLVSASMFVLFVEAYKLFASLDIPGYEPAIGVGLLLVSGLFLIAIFTSLTVSLMDCRWESRLPVLITIAVSGTLLWRSEADSG